MGKYVATGKVLEGLSIEEGDADSSSRITSSVKDTGTLKRSADEINTTKRGRVS